MQQSANALSQGSPSSSLTNRNILIISFIAWTLSNMDQAFFGYALPGILEEFDLPLEAAGVILTISFVNLVDLALVRRNRGRSFRSRSDA